MTNPSPNLPPEPPTRRSFSARVLRIAKHPATLVIGVSVVAIAAVGYAGIRYFIYTRLNPLVESQLSKIVKKPVYLGEVESLSWTLNRIRLGASSIPATPGNRDRIDIKEIEISFNPFPVLFGQPLPIEATVIDPNAYLEQDANGEWLEYELPEGDGGELPIDLDINVNVRDGDVALRPYRTTKAIPIQAEGLFRYLDADEKLIGYDVDAALLGSKINAEGETNVDTGKSEVALVVEKLALAPLLAIIPNSPVKLNSGQLDANLNVSLPTLTELDNLNRTRGKGDLNLSQIEANIASIKEPVRANLALSLQGQKLFIEQARASIGQVVAAQISGDVDWERGYNLNIKTNQVNIANLLRTVSVNLPVRVGGEAQANLQLTGLVNQPILTGSLNSTRPLQIDKTQLRQVRTNFQADLNKIVVQRLQIQPTAGGQIIASGRVQTNIEQALENDRPIDFTKMPLAFNFRTQLPTEEVAAPYYEFPTDITIGTLTAQGQVKGTVENPLALVKWQIPRAGVTQNVDVSGTGEIFLRGDNLALRNTVLRTDEGIARINGSGNFQTKRWQTLVTANSFILTPFLSPICNQNPAAYCSYLTTANPTLENANVVLSGRLDDFNPNTLAGIANLNLRLDRGSVALRSELSKGLIEASAVASQIPLNPLLPNNIAAPVSLSRSQINVSGAIADLLEGSTVAAKNFDADIEALLNVAGDTVAASGELQNGLLEAAVTSGRIALNELVPNLPIAAQVRDSRVRLTGDVAQLVASLENSPDLSSFQATADVRLGVANGIVNTLTQLNNNRWTTNIVASDLNTRQILAQLPNTRNFSQQDIPNLNGLINLSGPVAPLLQPNRPLPIQANTIALRLQQQALNLDANGALLISNLFSKPDIANINLNVKANSTLDRLPLTELLAQVPVRRSLLPRELDVTGDGQFQGRFAGRNLISAPTAPGNLLLAGNLRLEDFTLNDRPFDPVLAGPVTIALGQEIALNLQGEDDVIAANLEPCDLQRCPAPYLVSSFQLRQTTEDLPPIIAQGQQIGDRLVAEVESFPLDILNIYPGEEYGIIGELSGQLQANLDVNLNTLTGSGDISIDNPRVGYREARSFNASLSYNNNIARLDSAVLELENSRYEGQGAINIATGAIDGRLEAERGYVQDVLAALQIYDIPTLIDFFRFQEVDYANAEQVQTQPVGTSVNASIAEQVNRLWAIDKKIRALAAQREAGGAPTELDIRGAFDTTVTLAGNIRNPQINFQFQGDNWDWSPQPAFATIVRALGLVITDTQTIPINNIAIEGSLQNGVVQIEPARVQVRDSIVTFAGGFRPATQTLLPSEVVVQNLSLDTVNTFVQLPVDVAGNIRAKANLSGQFLNPNIKGNFTFADGALNGRVIDRTIVGNFNYANYRLEARTTAPESILIYASVPYPTQLTDDNRVVVDVNLGTDALELLDVVTQGQVAWLGGEGQVQLAANGLLDTSDGFRLYDLTANGQVNLANATLRSAALPQPIVVNGQIDLKDQLLQVQQLQGNFAQSTITAKGVLPLFFPLSRRDRNATNPLTVAIDNGQIDLQNLYRGGVDAEVIITGAAISPAIGGDVRLSNGQVFVPQQQNNAPQGAPIIRQPSSGGGGRRQDPTFAPRLDDLNVALENLSIESDPLYQFDFGGNLTLNGLATNLSELQGKGAILLNRGRVSLLETRFLLDRRYENTIVFDPEQGLLNPDLNIRMRTLVSEFPNARRQATEQTNEIPDDNLTRVERIDITLALEGELSQLLPGLGRNVANVCQLRPASAPPIPRQTNLTQEQLDQLETCLQVVATRGSGDSDVQLLSNPLVDLSSSPPRSDGEIVQLLSEQFFALADVLQSQNTSQLLEYGLVQLALPMILQGVVYDVENTVSNAIGAADVRLFPLIETNYQVGEDAFVGVSYDYSFNEFRVQYETRF